MLAAVSAAIVAAGLAFLQVRAEVSRMTSLHIKLSSDLVKIFHLLGRKLLGAAKLS